MMEPTTDNPLAEADNAVVGNNEPNLQQQDVVKEKEVSMGPMKVLEPLRTDPVKALQVKARRLERLSVACMPELHYVGQIVSGKGIIKDSTEGACCRFKIDHGKAWEHLGGDVFGQTQIAYSQDKICMNGGSACIALNHPLDLHFASAGLQGWGAPRITVQCYRMDWHGRRLLSGYGFAHLPTTPGYHRIEISLWRPVGSTGQELEAHLLGSTPALATHQPIYEAAWRERCRLVTTSTGQIFIDLFVVTRFMKGQGVDSK